jgi:hypothetical protein
LKWLVWLKNNNPLYADMEIDMDEIHSLPANGDVIDRVKQVVEREEEKEEAEQQKMVRDLVVRYK